MAGGMDIDWMGLFDKPAPKSPQPAQSAYKCLSCGKELKGMVLYCDGCSGYVCRGCAIPASDDDSSAYNCPNCSSRLQFFTI